ncbi:MAG: hypothetical protein K0S33_512 [Bacteroidetes bacterium]|jgi:hypothetical protein|nr:hypothetical protein [Bacteroidota bacterium]
MKTKLIGSIAGLFFAVFYYEAVAQHTQTGKKIAIHSLQNNFYSNYVEPAVCSDSGKVYAMPDTNSEVLRAILFNTDIHLLGKGEDTEEIVVEKIAEDGHTYKAKSYLRLIWYKIELDNWIGYIRASDVATHTFTDSKGKFKYFFQTENSCRLLKYDINTKKWADTLEIEHLRGDIVRVIESAGWKNTDILFRVTRINAFCGGGTRDEFIIDANGKLSGLLSTDSYADDGSADAYGSTVWLPLKFNKGKILLIANGDVEQVFDTYSGQLNVYPFPKGVTIPPTELIVFKESEIKSLYAKNGEPLLKPDGSYRSTVKNTTKYFRWNGTKLIRIK